MQSTLHPAPDLLMAPSAITAAPAGTRRVTFEAGFEAELRRLDELGRELEAWEEENMLSALGAAALGEYELAAAFLEAVRRPSPSPSSSPRNFRRLPMSVPTLRRRFERLADRRGAAVPRS